MNSCNLLIKYNVHKYLQYTFYIFFDVWKLFYLHNNIHIFFFKCSIHTVTLSITKHTAVYLPLFDHFEDIKWFSCFFFKLQVKCAKPKPVHNAVIRDEYANIETFKEGDEVEYDCELGYTIKGITRERWCRNTSWTEVRFTCNRT
jgi:hypothetical protein